MHGTRLECPRCSRHLQPGSLLEKGNGDRTSVTQWVEDVPDKSFWTGLALKGRQVLPVTTFRCERCGYLEPYAGLDDAQQ
jgi:hypothetical protein